MLTTYADRIERLSPAQARSLLEADYLNQHTRLTDPCGMDTVRRNLLKLRGVNVARADRIIRHALAV